MYRRNQVGLSLLSKNQAITTSKFHQNQLPVSLLISQRNFSSNNNAQQFEEAQKQLQTLQKSPGNIGVKFKINDVN